MKGLILIVIPFLLACQKPEGQAITSNVSADEIEAVLLAPHPTVSFTFDDGITHDLAGYPFEDWNNMILSSLSQEGVKAAFFVTGSNKKNEKGHYLLQSWSEQGHLIANHTYSHPNFNGDLDAAKFETELLATDDIIKPYEQYTRLFRFPYLKEGKTVEQIEGYRQVLAKHGYSNGYVTIDASDWYVNSELLKHIKQHGMDSPKVQSYQEYYLMHILDRAKYYEQLSFDLTGRHIPHTLLLHHNLTSALFLDDLMQAFKNEGWKLTDAQTAFEDSIFQSLPETIPAGESLIWSLAKQSGQYEDQLRYPAEDSRYEQPKMEALGL